MMLRETKKLIKLSLSLSLTNIHPMVTHTRSNKRLMHDCRAITPRSKCTHSSTEFPPLPHCPTKWGTLGRARDRASAASHNDVLGERPLSPQLNYIEI